MKDLRQFDQLRIPVDPAPNAVGWWTLDHEIAAYRSLMGEDPTERQRRLALEAKDCTCGKQETADNAAIADGRRPKKLLGWEHIPGCNSYIKRAPKLARISDEEQLARYDSERADQLNEGGS